MKIFLAAAGGGWNWFQRAFWPDQENIKAKESIPKSRAEILAEESKVLRPYILESFLMTTPKSEQYLPLYSDYMLDSGAFTMLMDNAKKLI